MKITLNRKDIFLGGFIYFAGDTTAAILLGEFGWIRMLGVAFIGATLYAIEIPNYFRWVDKTVTGNFPKLKKTLLAMLYFNPLWIARHIFLIKLFSFDFDQIDIGLFRLASLSFLGAIPTSLLGNYIIQNRINLNWRFIASSFFSGLMAIYYALSSNLL